MVVEKIEGHVAQQQMKQDLAPVIAPLPKEAQLIYTGIPEITPPVPLHERGFLHVPMDLEEERMYERMVEYDRRHFLISVYQAEKLPWE